MQLSKTLLKHDFGLTLSLPGNRLCPPVRLQSNQSHWAYTKMVLQDTQQA